MPGARGALLDRCSASSLAVFVSVLGSPCSLERDHRRASHGRSVVEVAICGFYDVFKDAEGELPQRAKGIGFPLVLSDVVAGCEVVKVFHVAPISRRYR